MLNLWIPEFIHGRLLRCCRFGQHKKGHRLSGVLFHAYGKVFFGEYDGAARCPGLSQNLRH